MSIRVMTDVWDSGLYEGGTLLVLLALADWAGDDGGRVYPKVESVAEKARLTVRAVQNSLKKLRADGIIREVSGAKRGKATEYKIDLKRLKEMRCNNCGANTSDESTSSVEVKSERNEVQSATAHIDNHQEPSKEPSLSASENSPSVKPKEEPSSAWPEIWTAFQSWPGSEKQDWSERKAKTAWEALAPRPPDTDLILCIRTRAARYAAENLERKAAGRGPKWPTNPARWLGERHFDRMLDEAHRAATATLAAEAARPMALSEPVRERLITAGVATGEIKSYFAGCVHRHGPPEEFIFETQFAAELCESRCGARLRRAAAFGEDLIIAVAKKMSAA